MITLFKAMASDESETPAFQRVEAIFQDLKKKDRYYEGHICRACHYAADFGRQQGLTKKELRQLYLATLLHDIGKAMIPPGIINKQAPLSDEERNILRAHPSLGEKMCLELGEVEFEEIAPLVGAHHERPNGTGYPRGLKGDEIPQLARILAVIEIYDALRSTRSYKIAFSREKSLEILHQNVARGNLDRNVVEEFTRFVEKTNGRQADLNRPEARIQFIISADG